MSDEVYRTKSGRVLAALDLEQLANEAEEGYEVDASSVKLRTTVGELIEWLDQFPDNAFIYPYEGEISAVVVVDNKLRQLGSLQTHPMKTG